MKSGFHSILVIDDDPNLLQGLQEILKSQGFEVQTAADGKSGLHLIKENFFDLVLTDLSLPDVGGMEILQFLVKHHPECPCIIITGFGTIKSSVDAMRSGAYDYLTKPVNPTELLLVVERALDHRRLKWENLRLKKQLQRRYGFANILGKSEAILQIFEIIEKVADTDSTVLIQGESGTGKELIARAIHYNSSRQEGPLIPVNCGAIPGELLESELFGHERGAFTQAVRTRLGRFELANGGTIFLDEIAEMRPDLQVKILRVLQERSFERIGGVKTIRVDIRVIAATNKDLENLVRQGRFREDLYYRLNVIPIKVPPLREREDDIPLLARHFLKDFCARKKTPPKHLTAVALSCLSQYSWPGNVRELENLMERLAILAEGEVVDVADLPPKFHPRPLERLPKTLDFPPQGIDLIALVRDFEKNLILQALDRSQGVKSRAAQLLHLNRTTLVEKMKKQQIRYPSVTATENRD
jgi:DNA-binding NtrC family response regulator